MLAIAVTVIVLAFSLKTRPDQLVEFRWLPGYPMPETCMSRAWFGVSCPGCGLTRSFISLVRGDWAAAFQYSRVTFVLAFTVLTQIPYRTFMLLQLSKHGMPEPDIGIVGTVFSWLIIVALVGNWCLLVTGY